jgi:hypothetical protein
MVVQGEQRKLDVSDFMEQIISISLSRLDCYERERERVVCLLN